jgi:hypothetical protein
MESIADVALRLPLSPVAKQAQAVKATRADLRAATAEADAAWERYVAAAAATRAARERLAAMEEERQTLRRRIGAAVVEGRPVAKVDEVEALRFDTAIEYMTTTTIPGLLGLDIRANWAATEAADRVRAIAERLAREEARLYETGNWLSDGVSAVMTNREQEAALRELDRQDP